MVCLLCHDNVACVSTVNHLGTAFSLIIVQISISSTASFSSVCVWGGGGGGARAPIK